MSLLVEQVGPVVSVQDAGREGRLGLGLSRGGAADRHAYLAACALAGVARGSAAIEMAGMGGRFRFETGTRFALTGARMRATLDGAPLVWNAAHIAAPGNVLEIGAAENGVYGYLLPGGGVTSAETLGGRGYHKIAGLGRALRPGDQVPFADAPTPKAPPMRFAPAAPESGPVRVMPGPQSALFPDETRTRFEATTFIRSARADRQGVRLEQDGAPFAAGAQLQRVSDFISEGDIQMTGDGTPYVLLSDCQTMGGYPRIGTVIPPDLPRIAQALPGEAVQFRFVSLAEAEALWMSDEDQIARLKRSLEPLVRDPRAMSDLLSYELIGKPLDR